MRPLIEYGWIALLGGTVGFSMAFLAVNFTGVC